MKPLKRLQLGKKGLTPEFIEQVKGMFKHGRLVKITLLKSACRNKQDAVALCETLLEVLGPNYNYTLIGYVVTVKKYRKAQR